MSGRSLVPAASCILRLLSLSFRKLVIGLNAVGTGLILLMAILINADIFGRFLFSSPITGVPEIVQISIVAIVFLQTGHTVSVGRFIRADALFMKLLQRRPRAGHALGLLYDLTGAFLFFVISWATAPRVVRAFDENYFIGSPGVFVAPSWPIYFVVAFGCAVASVQFVSLAFNEWRAMRGTSTLKDEEFRNASQ